MAVPLKAQRLPLMVQARHPIARRDFPDGFRWANGRIARWNPHRNRGLSPAHSVGHGSTRPLRCRQQRSVAPRGGEEIGGPQSVIEAHVGVISGQAAIAIGRLSTVAARATNLRKVPPRLGRAAGVAADGRLPKIHLRLKKHGVRPQRGLNLRRSRPVQAHAFQSLEGPAECVQIASFD